MNESTLPLQLRMFNDRVRAMSQANSKTLVLNADEARNLHAEIYNLLALAVSNIKTEDTSENITVRMDGGRFK